ncbi:hypothetical protein CAEBREN_15455 [Caenorhabditis brenneri]|uniref:CCR4-NOT transcription complex subunit 11 n=1 Tax=Caenorhabditis brenneri TaxID=135651 RepID=G0MQX5_CAEBE|nr:hypothetical protein CAEBREN_15455 [Caenorhabditis brenneri]
MTKKKQKKGQKPTTAVPGAEQKDKENDDLDMLEDIKRDEDLFISESDVANISNFIRTTNKSFNSLGNTVVEKFANRCSLAFLHALIALFDTDSTDREDVIRRLNIIYIVWRLPECEQELRMKPTKTMSDVYCHPFATFLFYAEQLKKHVVESTLARIIVTNNVSVIEKLTAPDFIQKAKSLDLHKVDLEAFARWSEANTDHWPEITEEMVSLSKAMRELGTERKDYEAGMAEAFYPLVHYPPTMLPPRMAPLPHEDPQIMKWMRTHDPDNREAETVIYSMSAPADIQERLTEAFKAFAPTVDKYQAKIDSVMTPEELQEMRREITLDGEWTESSESEVSESDIDSDSEAEAEERFRAMTEPPKEIVFNEKTVEECLRRIFEGTTLSSSKVGYANQFVRRTPLVHPLMARIIEFAEQDENLVKWCHTNPKFATEFMIRYSLIDEPDGLTAFKRFLGIWENNPNLTPAFEYTVRISLEFKQRKRLTTPHREAVLNFVQNVMKKVEDQPAGTNNRGARLVAMLITKLLKEDIINAEAVATFVKPFCLKFSDHRECTQLFQVISDIQAGKTMDKKKKDEIISTTSTTTTGSPSMMTTTTTTTSVNPNATSTTTTTTVVRQCGPAMIKQTSKKVVLQGHTIQMQIKSATFKALGALCASTSAFFHQQTASLHRHHHSSGQQSSSSAPDGPSRTFIEVLDPDTEELTLSEHSSDDEHVMPPLVFSSIDPLLLKNEKKEEDNKKNKKQKKKDDDKKPGPSS